jgi:hypothetical protein
VITTILAILGLSITVPLAVVLAVEGVKWLRLDADGRLRAYHENDACDPDRCRYCQYEMTEDA